MCIRDRLLIKHCRTCGRHHSYLSPIARGVIVGLGTQGYLLALEYFANNVE